VPPLRNSSLNASFNNVGILGSGVFFAVLAAEMTVLAKVSSNLEFPQSRVEAGSNISTVALRVVGGDEKGTQCLGV
jgi:hypothetical protein